MGETTGIAWADRTWNPWHGCLKVSPGCKLCYMYREKKQYGQNPMLVQRSKTKFNEPLKWNSGRVFTCSWSDFFIEEADAWRPEAWEIIRKTPQLTYQILTKRPERIAAHLPADWGDGYSNVWLGVSVESQKYANERIPLLLKTPAA
jgi:protein gp37